MDYIKLTDGTQVAIEDSASLDHIIHISDTEADAVAVCKTVTAANLKHVEFCMDDGTAYGVYDDLALNAAPTRQDNENGTVTIILSLREKTDLEKRLDALEESQEIQDGAIEDIGTALSDIAEGV